MNDHELHVVLNFEKPPDPVILKKAVSLLIQAVPILSRAYIYSNGLLYWDDMKSKNWEPSFKVVNNKQDFDKFFFQQIKAATSPQIKVCLLSTNPGALSIIMNHMVTDGAGFKECLYLLADIYTNLVNNTDYIPNFIIDGDRSLNPILSKITTYTKVKELLSNSKDNNQKSNYKFPMSISENCSPFVLVHNIGPDSFFRMKNYCKKYKVTVNDLLLTGFFRALSKILNIDGEMLSIPIMIDMRRHLENTKTDSITNLTSTATVRICINQKEDFSETLSKISSVMKEKKAGYLGMNTFIKLDTVLRLVGYKFGLEIIDDSLNNPYIAISNIGVLDSTKLIFINAPVSNAFICGSIKNRPYFQLAVTTYNNNISLCVNLCGNQEDKENVLNFFEIMDHELKQV